MPVNMWYCSRCGRVSEQKQNICDACHVERAFDEMLPEERGKDCYWLCTNCGTAFQQREQTDKPDQCRFCGKHGTFYGVTKYFVLGYCDLNVSSVRLAASSTRKGSFNASPVGSDRFSSVAGCLIPIAYTIGFLILLIYSLTDPEGARGYLFWVAIIGWGACTAIWYYMTTTPEERETIERNQEIKKTIGTSALSPDSIDFSLRHKWTLGVYIPYYVGGHPDLPQVKDTEYADKWLTPVVTRNGEFVVASENRVIFRIDLRDIEEVVTSRQKPAASAIFLVGLIGLGTGERFMYITARDKKYGKVELLFSYGGTAKGDDCIREDYPRLQAAISKYKSITRENTKEAAPSTGGASSVPSESIAGSGATPQEIEQHKDFIKTKNKEREQRIKEEEEKKQEYKRRYKEKVAIYKEQGIREEEESKEEEFKECPFCVEIIKAKAIKCRYCGSMLDGSEGG